jgi:hypothetical protein
MVADPFVVVDGCIRMRPIYGGAKPCHALKVKVILVRVLVRYGDLHLPSKARLVERSAPLGYIHVMRVYSA